MIDNINDIDITINTNLNGYSINGFVKTDKNINYPSRLWLYSDYCNLLFSSNSYKKNEFLNDISNNIEIILPTRNFFNKKFLSRAYFHTFFPNVKSLLTSFYFVDNNEDISNIKAINNQPWESFMNTNLDDKSIQFKSNKNDNWNDLSNINNNTIYSISFNNYNFKKYDVNNLFENYKYYNSINTNDNFDCKIYTSNDVTNFITEDKNIDKYEISGAELTQEYIYLSYKNSDTSLDFIPDLLLHNNGLSNNYKIGSPVNYGYTLFFKPIFQNLRDVNLFDLKKYYGNMINEKDEYSIFKLLNHNKVTNDDELPNRYLCKFKRHYDYLSYALKSSYNENNNYNINIIEGNYDRDVLNYIINSQKYNLKFSNILNGPYTQINNNTYDFSNNDYLILTSNNDISPEYKDISFILQINVKDKLKLYTNNNFEYYNDFIYKNKSGFNNIIIRYPGEHPLLFGENSTSRIYTGWIRTFTIKDQFLSIRKYNLYNNEFNININPEYYNGYNYEYKFNKANIELTYKIYTGDQSNNININIDSPEATLFYQKWFKILPNLSKESFLNIKHKKHSSYYDLYYNILTNNDIKQIQNDLIVGTPLTFNEFIFLALKDKTLFDEKYIVDNVNQLNVTSVLDSVYKLRSIKQSDHSGTWDLSFGNIKTYNSGLKKNIIRNKYFVERSSYDYTNFNDINYYEILLGYDTALDTDISKKNNKLDNLLDGDPSIKIKENPHDEWRDISYDNIKPYQIKISSSSSNDYIQLRLMDEHYYEFTNDITNDFTILTGDNSNNIICDPNFFGNQQQDFEKTHGRFSNENNTKEFHNINTNNLFKMKKYIKIKHDNLDKPVILTDKYRGFTKPELINYITNDIITERFEILHGNSIDLINDISISEITTSNNLNNLNNNIDVTDVSDVITLNYTQIINKSNNVNYWNTNFHIWSKGFPNEDAQGRALELTKVLKSLDLSITTSDTHYDLRNALKTYVDRVSRFTEISNNDISMTLQNIYFIDKSRHSSQQIRFHLKRKKNYEDIETRKYIKITNPNKYYILRDKNILKLSTSDVSGMNDDNSHDVVKDYFTFTESEIKNIKIMDIDEFYEKFQFVKIDPDIPDNKDKFNVLKYVLKQPQCAIYTGPSLDTNYSINNKYKYTLNDKTEQYIQIENGNNGYTFVLRSRNIIQEFTKIEFKENTYILQTKSFKFQKKNNRLSVATINNNLDFNDQIQIEMRRLNKDEFINLNKAELENYFIIINGNNNYQDLESYISSYQNDIYTSNSQYSLDNYLRCSKISNNQKIKKYVKVGIYILKLRDGIFPNKTNEFTISNIKSNKYLKNEFCLVDDNYYLSSNVYIKDILINNFYQNFIKHSNYLIERIPKYTSTRLLPDSNKITTYDVNNKPYEIIKMYTNDYENISGIKINDNDYNIGQNIFISLNIDSKIKLITYSGKEILRGNFYTIIKYINNSSFNVYNIFSHNDYKQPNYMLFYDSKYNNEKNINFDERKNNDLDDETELVIKYYKDNNDNYYVSTFSEPLKINNS